MRVVITRAENEAQKLAGFLKSSGHTSLVAPMMDIEIIKTKLDTDSFSGFVTTSSNGIRSLAASTDKRDMPVYCVGGQSEKLATEQGFTNTEHSIGNHKNLTIFIARHVDPSAGTLCYMHGDVVQGSPIKDLRQKGFKVQPRLSYTAAPIKTLPADVLAEFESENPPEAVTFFSIRTFRLFKDVMVNHGLVPKLKDVSAVCLSSAIADFARELRWKSVVSAKENSGAAILDAINDLKTEA